MVAISRLVPVLACVAAVALGGSAPAIATSAAATAGGQLEVLPSGTLGASTYIRLSAWTYVNARPAPTAGVTILAPRGYDIDLGRPPGTEVGSAFALLEDASGGSESPEPLIGPLVADDPVAYLQDVDAQACAPGRHAAVWRTADSSAPQTLRLLVFVDPVANGSGAGYTLRMCPLWNRSAQFPGGLTASTVLLGLKGVKAPTAPGVYTWSAVVTPGNPETFAPQPDGTFELRAVIPLPHLLTLRARHAAKTRSVVLSGRLAAADEPVPGVSVTVTAYTGTYDYTEYGAVRTNADGAFSLERAIDRTTVFTASAEIRPRACTAPSSAPGGCLIETVSPPTEPTTSLRILRATDAKRAIRKRDQALAGRAALRRADFPSGWETEQPNPFSLCEAFQPDLSDLTVTGDARSSQFHNDEALAMSSTSVYRTTGQARAAFRRTARLEAARCLARDLRDAEFQVLRVEKLTLPPLGVAAQAFRVIADFRETIVYFDIVSIRGGRVAVEMLFVSLKQPLLIEQDLAAKVAARIR